MRDTAVITVFARDAVASTEGSATLNVTGNNAGERRQAALAYAQDTWPESRQWDCTVEDLNRRVNGKHIEFKGPAGWQSR